MSRAILSLVLITGCGEILLSGGGDDEGRDAGAGDAGPSGEGACVPTSGERLRRVMRVHDDGSSEQVDLVDVKLGVRCELTVATDGVTRCMPEGLPYWYGRVVYRDATCSQTMIEVTPGGEAATHVRAWGSSGQSCIIPYRYFELGAATSAEGGVVYDFDDGGNCVGEPAGDLAYRTVAEEITVDRFTATTDRWVGAGRIQTRAIEGEDGSRQCRVGGPFFDQELGIQCSFNEDENGTMRCMPDGPPIDTYYTDASCSTPVSAGRLPASCAPDYPYGLEMTLPGTCTGFRFRVRELGDAVAPGYEMSGGCRAINPEVHRLVAAGDFVPSTSLAGASRELVGGGERLSRVALVSDGGAEQFAGMWFDRTLGAHCRFDTAGDGSQRCIPRYTIDRPVSAVRHWFSDAACTVPLTVASDTECPGSEPPTLALGDSQAGELNRVWRIGAAYTGPAYVQTGAGCSDGVGSSPRYSLGAELLPSEMVGGEVMTQ
jgi:hypothetical protein